MLCDNEAVYRNVLTPELTLKKKNVSILYHKCKEDVAFGVARIAKVGTAANLADMLTKMLVQIRHETLLNKFTY